MDKRMGFLAALAAGAIVSAAQAGEPWHFTVTADMRGEHGRFETLCNDINTRLGGPGAFHVSVGDVDETVAENRAVIDAKFGAAAVWYPIIGNHEEETGADMQWLRNEYDSGNGVRTPLNVLTNDDGPAGTRRVMYTWDCGDAHFVATNQYWNGGPTEGAGTDISRDDTARSGDVVGPLRDWLSADLASNTRPFVFVFGHEPAYPQPWQRHSGDSLDAYPANRDAFWQVLEDHGVQVFLCGHTHQYARSRPGTVTEHLDAGNAGNWPDAGEGLTYFDVVVSDTQAVINVYRDGGTGVFALADSVTVTPEPAAAALLVAGACLPLLRRRKQAGPALPGRQHRPSRADRPSGHSSRMGSSRSLPR